ncbi:piezo-type mechanosensitive ion channel component [Rhynchospora pubera]|uniref:Piezo-type mechanosensitive ion channel component n=1 Tax=Rhynchospora pubera TaxID=906938 RepID=A0AAV8DSY4_9POAL|nr:piezo-type mechanosensitive ion channel component [Rhynchospora pubera]
MARRMGGFLGRCLLPLLLLAASLIDWSLLSLVNLLLFFALRFTSPPRGFYSWKIYAVAWSTVIYSALAIFAQTTFLILWIIEGNDWPVATSSWATLFGFIRHKPWDSASFLYFIVLQLSAALVALVQVLGSRLSPDSCWIKFSSRLDHIGYHLREASCFLVPGVQLVVSISYPSWTSIPFFIFSCVGLVDWSLTSNFLALFRWWRPLEIYSVFNILLLYIYQLPVTFPKFFTVIAEFIGLYKMTTSKSDWLQICSGVSLLVYYFMLSSIKHDIQEMDSMMSGENNTLTERLLPSRNTFFVRRNRSGKNHTNVLLRGAIFRSFSINFFTYGFPVLLLALSFWSFNFNSICAFGLLAYVGYILYAFPSLFDLHRLNGSLLVFILLWTASTYVFNVGFTFFNKKFQKDMVIWETIGLWHYSIPALFLLAQYCLGVFVALCNLVNNSVFLYLSGRDGQSADEDHGDEEKEDTMVLIVATLAWGLRKISRAITLGLMFLLVIKPGFIHAAYMCFFMLFLLSHEIRTELRQTLILFCEVHFSILYILQLDLVSKALENWGPVATEVLSQLGLSTYATTRDFLQIGLLLCFCAIHNHGYKMLLSLSRVLKDTPYPPIGFAILRTGLNKSVLLSVYSSQNFGIGRPSSSSNEKRISRYLSKVGQKCLSLYRSYGTYVAFLTILSTLYLVTPNYISFGYLFFLLFWIIGRQLTRKTKRRLWLPLKVYAAVVFVCTYSLSITPGLATWVSKYIKLYPDLGFDPEASLLHNVWQSLAVLIVMQLYSYERRMSRFKAFDMSDPAEISFCGFLRRFLIWHSDKILSVTVFYASLSSISLFGFFYLLGLIICSTLPKVSQVPSKVFLLYTGLIATTEYLFQMWCKPAQMCPTQTFHSFAVFLGFNYYDSGFWGLEAGLRGKILVIIACLLQYNVFHWLDLMPISLVHKGKWEEPCQLFLSRDNSAASNGSSIRAEVNNIKSRVFTFFSRRPSQSLDVIGASSHPHGSTTYKESDSMLGDDFKYSFSKLWGSSKESQKWNKNRIVALKKERSETQINTLKAYARFWFENLFKIRGLEFNMVMLLLASFAVLNVVSMFYIACLVIFILLSRELIRMIWPIFVFLFASILVLEYFALWRDKFPWTTTSNDSGIHCNDCWKYSKIYFSYCVKCWLGITVDDSRMLLSYYLVFIFSSFKLRLDHFSGFSDSYTYRQMRAQMKNALVWKDLSFEIKSLWTFMDYVRLYAYCHLLDIVLSLILITGTLEYDVLHLGYLGFALVFFRMRLQILKKKNKIFKYLRIYNFVLIVLSLAYQSPFVGDFSSGSKCEELDYLYEIVGFYKYDYGFRITSRSALVEIIIFLLVSLQSYIFASSEFDHIARYLEAEQIGAMVREQEKKAARKTEQLQHIRESEERKRQRNWQVEKMKSEMLNLQLQIDRMSSIEPMEQPSPRMQGLRKRKVGGGGDSGGSENGTNSSLAQEESKAEQKNESEERQSFEFTPIKSYTEPLQEKAEPVHPPPGLMSEYPSPMDYVKHSLDPVSEITELGEDEESVHSTLYKKEKEKEKSQKENPLKSAVQLLGDGVSQVQSLGNQAVTNIVSFLNIDPNQLESSGHSSHENMYGETANPRNDSETNIPHGRLTRMPSIHARTGEKPQAAAPQIRVILRHIWSQMRSNNDYVCYCCFVLVFLWNFSLSSMVYLAALFLYALCANSGPSYLFWVTMLIYTELNILAQYVYQIIIQHCGLSIKIPILQRLGFPEDKIKVSFVASVLPLFLVYITTLLESSITASDGEWVLATDISLLSRRRYDEEVPYTNYSLSDSLKHFLSPVVNALKMVGRSCIWYWRSLTQGAESPPYFVQLTMDVKHWPEDGIQPERIESWINRILANLHEERCKSKSVSTCSLASRVRIQSINKSEENEKMALAVLEVVYASPAAGCQVAEWYKSLTPAADVAKEIQDTLSEGMFEEVGFPYPVVSVIGGGKREIDLYAFIFCADLAVFFLVAMFYQSVIKNTSEILEYYQLADQFPKEFVFILMVLFFLIVVDRIIYLWSFATGRFIFYIFNLVLFTYSVTKYAWNMESSNRSISALVLRAIYLTKSVSLALQALQLHHGIPNKSTLYRQFLTSKVTQVNYLGFRLYRALPFLYELRCVLDWSCTTTSLTMYDWLKLEDIYASLFLVKCDALLNRANHKIGQKQSKMTKFCSGICLFLILICVIWAPMLIYSSGNPTNIANPVIDVSLQVDVKAHGGRLMLFQTTACERIHWVELDTDVDLDPNHYLDTYNVEDIQLVCCQPDASTMWLIPPVVRKRYVQTLDLDEDNLDLIITWIFIRARPKGKESVKYESIVDSINGYSLKRVLNGTSDRFTILDGYPRYFRVTGSGEVRRLDYVADSVSGDLVLNNGTTPWWSYYNLNLTDSAGCSGLDGPMAIVVSEETPQGILGETLSKFSIWSLYITFVLAVARFIRLQCSDLRMRIPYENLPSCDRLLDICEGIYAARAEGELEVEEVLYWTLVKIYRSPHMLMEYTKDS